MDLLLQVLNLGLTDVRIESVLHFPLQLVVALPEQDLSLAFNNLVKEVGFLLPESVDLYLKCDGLSFQVLQLLTKFALDVNIFVQ